MRIRWRMGRGWWGASEFVLCLKLEFDRNNRSDSLIERLHDSLFEFGDIYGAFFVFTW
jgi:hypothetical protein